VILMESAWQERVSVVSSWQSTHLFQSIRCDRFVPDVLGCWGSKSLRVYLP
jgi:hypothetical protein